MKLFAIILAAVLVCAAADTSSAAPVTFLAIEPDCVCTAGGKCTCGPGCECAEQTCFKNKPVRKFFKRVFGRCK